MAPAALDAFVWDKPVAGPLALSFVVTSVSSDAVTCAVSIAYDDASGRDVSWSAAMVRDGTMRPSFLIVGSKWHQAQVHFMGNIDTREYVPPTGDNQRIELAWDDVGVIAGARYTFAFAALDASASTQVRVQCPGAVLGEPLAGRHAALFDAASMHGGLGASVNPLLPVVGGSTTLWESQAMPVSEPNARVFLLGSGVLAAEVDIYHPSGVEKYQHTASPETRWSFHGYDGPAGDYEAVVTHVSGDGTGIVGVLVGMDVMDLGVDWTGDGGHGHECGYCSEPLPQVRIE